MTQIDEILRTMHKRLQPEQVGNLLCQVVAKLLVDYAHDEADADIGARKFHREVRRLIAQHYEGSDGR